jgi:hypothetical protein
MIIEKKPDVYQIECGLNKMTDDAAWTTEDHLKVAVKAIDKLFGDGYAKQHSHLVGSYLEASAINLQACFIFKSMQNMEERLESIASMFEGHDEDEGPGDVVEEFNKLVG